MAERDDKIPAMLQLLAPDGYYKYLGVSKVPPPPNNSSSTDGFIPTIDEEKVKKNYRRLSLKHHPDRPTGDAETFRVLKRARNVLLHSKLRQQYDLLGLDLDDDEDDEDDNGGGQQDSSDDGDGNNDGDSSKPSEESSGPESVLSQMASMALATLFQVIVRTGESCLASREGVVVVVETYGSHSQDLFVARAQKKVMMGLAATVVSRYRLLLFPAIGFLCFIAYRVQSIASQGGNPAASTMDMISPLMIGVGLVLMNRSLAKSNEWTWTYWIG